MIKTLQYSTVQYSSVQYSTVQYSTVQYSTVQYSTVQYSTILYYTIMKDVVISVIRGAAAYPHCMSNFAALRLAALRVPGEHFTPPVSTSPTLNSLCSSLEEK